MKQFYTNFSIVTTLSILMAMAVPVKQAGARVRGEGHATKVVKTDTLQVAFDIMGQHKHAAMMRNMKMSMSMMEHHKHLGYVVLVTVMDRSTHTVIKNAQVVLSLSAPARKRAVTKKTLVMQGGGMYHYMTYFKLKRNIPYTLIAKITIKGKTVRVRTGFKL